MIFCRHLSGGGKPIGKEEQIMMRDWETELKSRTHYIRGMVEESGASGVVYGNSGGKDATLVGILLKKSGVNSLGVIMPCESSRNYQEDRDDALAVAEQYDIPTIQVDITQVKKALTDSVETQVELKPSAAVNINPRLRMTVLYTVAGSKNYLVSGTGNRSESTMGYFTKWGDGAYDFNPISDLTVTEIYDFLRYLGAPENIIAKAPSAGLYEGQTDEQEMGITYEEIDQYILYKTGSEKNIEKIESALRRNAHKRRLPSVYKE